MRCERELLRWWTVIGWAWTGGHRAQVTIPEDRDQRDASSIMQKNGIEA
jgi:hypothetical protein